MHLAAGELNRRGGLRGADGSDGLNSLVSAKSWIILLESGHGSGEQNETVLA